MRDLNTFNTFSGLGVAIITPFKNGEVDYPALTEVVEHKINNQVDFLVALGSTGESNLLDGEEQKQVLAHIIKVNAGRLPVVAGHFSDISTRDVVLKIQSADLTGVDAIMISGPAYVKPPQEGIYQHFMKIAEASPLPIIIYNVPGRSKSNIEWETTIRLANDSTKFIGIKEASGDIIQTAHIAKHRPAHFILSSGDDDLCISTLAHGGEGLISVVGNAFPRETSQMVHHAMNGDFKTAMKIQYEMYSLYPYLFNQGNPAGVKAAMHILGFCENEVRLPLHVIDEKFYQELKAEMGRLQGLWA